MPYPYIKGATMVNRFLGKCLVAGCLVFAMPIFATNESEFSRIEADHKNSYQSYYIDNKEKDLVIVKLRKDLQVFDSCNKYYLNANLMKLNDRAGNQLFIVKAAVNSTKMHCPLDGNSQTRTVQLISDEFEIALPRNETPLTLLVPYGYEVFVKYDNYFYGNAMEP